MGDHGKLAKTIACALKRSGRTPAVTLTTEATTVDSQ